MEITQNVEWKQMTASKPGQEQFKGNREIKNRNVLTQ